MTQGEFAPSAPQERVARGAVEGPSTGSSNVKQHGFATGSMASPRAFHTATLLPNGTLEQVHEQIRACDKQL